MTKAAKLENLREEKKGPGVASWCLEERSAAKELVCILKPLHNKERFGAIAPGFQAHILAGLFDCLTLFDCF